MSAEFQAFMKENGILQSTSGSSFKWSHGEHHSNLQDCHEKVGLTLLGTVLAIVFTQTYGTAKYTHERQSSLYNDIENQISKEKLIEYEMYDLILQLLHPQRLEAKARGDLAR